MVSSNRIRLSLSPQESLRWELVGLKHLIASPWNLMITRKGLLLRLMKPPSPFNRKGVDFLRGELQIMSHENSILGCWT